MFRIITFNANGIRSASTKGFWEWFDQQQADVLCIQELKAQEKDLTPEVLHQDGYHVFMHCAQKRGYSGCAVYTKKKPDDVKIGFDNEEFDAEGRYVEVTLGNLKVISVYFPSGSSSEERQEAKYRFLDAFMPHLKNLFMSGYEVVVCGDVNIAHKEIDIKNWKGNLKNSGFLPQERQWLTDLFSFGWCDVFRQLDPSADRYTWWSHRGQARAKNVGWRIDYQIATPGLAQRARNTSIYNEEKFSDHAPLIIDYEM